MSQELTARTYNVGQYTCFAIMEPRLREIWASDFKDRITHHLLVSKIEPIWEKIFIHDSYACRNGKGAHKAVNKLKRFVTSHPDYKYLHIDVKGFFTNIDRSILYKIIADRVDDPDILYLAKIVIFANPLSNYIVKGNTKLLRDVPLHKSLFGVKPGKGLPIGNYTSQFFANVYLNELDQYAKRKLEVRQYFRYMDDIIILDKNSAKLPNLAKLIDIYLHKRLDISLHPKKTIIQDVGKGLDALGYKIFPDYTLSRKRIVGNVRQKLKHLNAGLKSSSSLDESLHIANKAIQIINSYWAHFKHANCSGIKDVLICKHFGRLTEYIEYDGNRTHFVLKEQYKDMMRRLKDGRPRGTG